MKTRATLLFVVLFLFSCVDSREDFGPVSAKALDDTSANRRAAAVKYLEVQPMQDMITNMTDQFSKSMPEEGRAAFKKQVMSSVDFKALEQAAIDAMDKSFTVAEIQALANFYGSKEGKAVMKKMPDYMATLMPHIHKQLMKTMAPQAGRPAAAPPKAETK
ncbi:DUF2059 domain-containing protein [Oligoflexia bacterium]|nr:DUF2059 domain-containing protein [Oligoflexia bacterium]